jgi:hypothetical protein
MTVVPDFGMSVVGSYFEAGFEEKAMHKVGEDLSAWVVEHVPDGTEVHPHVVHGRVYDQIIMAADRLKVDAIVMGSHRPELTDYLLGPNAARVVRHASNPFSWFEGTRAMGHVFGRGSAPLPTAVRGEGCYIYDAEGRAYLDGSGGAAVSCLGHSDADVRAAIHDQLDRIAFAHTGSSPPSLPKSSPTFWRSTRPRGSSGSTCSPVAPRRWRPPSNWRVSITSRSASHSATA